MEDGRCCGVYARNAATGKSVKATAKGGVILTCCDYAHDTAMLKHFVPSVVENEVPVMNPTMDVEGNYTATGDGHKMAAWAGVALQQWHAPMIHHMGGGAGIGGRGVIGNNGYLWPNLAGNMQGSRFAVEYPICLKGVSVSMCIFYGYVAGKNAAAAK